MVTWECALNYTGVHALARAIVAAGTVDDVYKIRAAFPKALSVPMLGDKFPNAVFGINDTGRMLIMASVQTITNGKSDPSVLYNWWSGNQKDADAVKKLSDLSTKNPVIWLKN
jgi:branched-chain amino acid transport system substrate-binding protein